MPNWTPDRLFSEIVMPAQAELIRMEYRGVAIDESLRRKRRNAMAKELESLAVDPILEGINPWSHDQVRKKLHSWKVTRAKSTNERFLKKLKRRRSDVAGFVDHVLRCRSVRKAKSTYLDAKAHPDGRLRTAYRLHVAETGRGRSGKDVFGLGTNLQNFPQSQRDWIVPDEGLVFWAADAKAIESRYVAWLSEDENYIQGFLDPDGDVHADHAVALFGIDRADVKKPIIEGSDWIWRDTGKRISHSWAYWISAFGLQERLEDEVPDMRITEFQARRFLDRLDQMRPGVAKWRMNVVNGLKGSRLMTTPWGRPRAFLGPWRASDGIPNSLHREAVAHLPQSSAGDHMHRALVRMTRKFREIGIPRAECLLYTHDETAGQCRLEDVEVVRMIATEAIAEPAPLEWKGHPLIIPADFAYGANWKEAHP